MAKIAFPSLSGITAMAKIARTEADKEAEITRNARTEIAALGKQVSDKTASQAENVAYGGFQSARQAVDAGAEAGQKIAGRAEVGMTEINQSLVELLTEQTKHNVQLFQALAQPTNWGKGPQLQSEFLRTSFQRAAQFARRYVEVGQAVLTSALPTARGQAKKAV
jgi:hypothetical protein